MNRIGPVLANGRPQVVPARLAPVVLNMFGPDRAGRLGNFLVLIAMTHLRAAKAGIPAENVFFRKNVDTTDGWTSATVRHGKRLPDYLSQNQSILAPIWDNFLSDGDILRLRQTRRVLPFDVGVNAKVIRDFERQVKDSPPGILSSLFYDADVFARQREAFPDYFSCDSVALHVRLTDFKWLKAAMGQVVDPAKKAATLLQRCTGKTVVVFSDDIAWCEQSLKAPDGVRLLFHRARPVPCDDLILMSCFRNVLQVEDISTYSLMAKLLSRDLQQAGRMTWCQSREESGGTEKSEGCPALHFMTFATSDWTKAHARMTKDLACLQSACSAVKSVEVLDEHALDDAWRARYGKYAEDHGYAYWSWKPYLLRQKLDRIADGDVLVYLDGGCTLPMNALSAFVDSLKKRCSGLSDRGFLGACVYRGPVQVWQQCPVALRRYFGIEENEEFNERFPHYEDGVMLIRKSKESVAFFDRWNQAFDDCYECALHRPYNGRPGEPRGFSHNNGDQAIYQCLLYLSGLTPVVCNDIFYEKYNVYSRTKG